MTQQQRVVKIYNQMYQIFSKDPIRHKNTLIQIKPPRMNIKFNRPKRYNAFTIDMYISVTQAIRKAQTMDDIKFIVFTGQGGNYSSGNDLTNFSNPQVVDLGDFPHVINAGSRFLKKFVDMIITSKKPLIAITQGQVIGVSFTQLALFDKVFAVDNSIFSAPLVSSAQGPEMCASYLFPKIFGRTVAQELVTFGKTVNAQYLQKYNFVQRCKTIHQANEKLQDYLNKIDELQWNSYINARRLYRQVDQQILLLVSQKQVRNLNQRWLNPNLLTYIAKHMQKMKRKPKL